MKKLYNFRLETQLIDDIDKLAVNRTVFVNDALRSALHNDLHNEVLESYQQNDYIGHLEKEIMYLRDLHQATMGRVLMLPSADTSEGGQGMAEDALESLKQVHTINTPRKAKNTSEGFKKNIINNKKNHKKKGFWSRFGF